MLSVEYLGYMASVFIILSLLTSNVKRFRYINLIGCSSFFVYGTIIQAYPVIVLNTSCILINIYNIIKLNQANRQN